MVMVDKADRHAMEVADRSKTEGIIIVPIVVPEPPEAGGVKPTPEIVKENPRKTACSVARRVTRRENGGRRRPIRTNPDTDLAEVNKEICCGRTMPRAPKEPKMDRAQPS